MHVGLIGGIGPAATEYYYRGLVRAYAALGKTLELTIVHADAGVLLNNLAKGDAERQARIFLEFVERLKAAGAELVAVTSLGGHFCINELEAISPLPLINAIPALDAYFAVNGYKTVGLLGTRAVMESRFYGGVTSAALVLPQGNDLDGVHDHYVKMAMTGHAEPEHQSFFHRIGRKLCDEQGADAVALAGTDLFLVFDGRQTEYPVVDCAKVHIDTLAAVST